MYAQTINAVITYAKWFVLIFLQLKSNILYVFINKVILRVVFSNVIIILKIENMCTDFSFCYKKQLVTLYKRVPE